MEDIHILLLEMPHAPRTLTTAHFSRAGFKVDEVRSLDEARHLLAHHKSSVAIIELGADANDALDLLSALDNDDIPVIAIADNTDAETRIVGFEHGAEDVISKPVNLRELYLRVARLRRRRLPGGPIVKMTMACGNASLHVATRVLKSPTGAPISLTASEFRLLYLLVSNEGRVVERAVIARDVLGQSNMTLSRSVDVMISKLRRKLKLAEAERFIRNIRSEGYLLIGDERTLPRAPGFGTSTQNSESTLPDKTR